MVDRDSLPELSLAIALYGGARAQAYRDWLNALTPELRSRIEVVFASHAAVFSPSRPILKTKVVVCASAAPARLWGAAVAASSGSHVALLDGHAMPNSAWLEAMLNALRGGGTRLWGPVACDYAPNDARIIGYLTEYAQFHPPVANELGEIPGNNLVIPNPSRSARQELKALGLSKTALLQRWKLSPDQWPTRIDQAIVTHCRAFSRYTYTVRRFRHGRAYGGFAAAHTGVVLRCARAILILGLPVLRVLRIRRHAKKVPLLSRAFLLHLPAIAMAETAWSLGELIGTLVGPGKTTDLLD